MSALISALAHPLWAASMPKARVAATVGSTTPAPIVAAWVARSEKSSGVSVWTRRSSSPTCSESNGRFSIGDIALFRVAVSEAEGLSERLLSRRTAATVDEAHGSYSHAGRIASAGKPGDSAPLGRHLSGEETR